jgi:hypothetical protein
LGGLARGNHEAELQTKIQELFAAGTRFVWVVRLTGPRRVEVHQPRQRMRIANPGEQLEAPGILANPVPVEALYDREAARRVIFHNLLQRQGYASLDDVRAEGEAQGLRKAVVAVFAARGLAVEGYGPPSPAWPRLGVAVPEKCRWKCWFMSETVARLCRAMSTTHHPWARPAAVETPPQTAG